MRSLFLGGVIALSLSSSTMADPRGEQASVVQRPPTPADVSPAYHQGTFWLDPRGQSWKRMDGSGVHAVWVYQDPAAPVIDEVGGEGPLAAFGTRRLTFAYAGPAFKLFRSRDAANLDIGFLPDGRLDEGALGSFCARTECRVGVWYDQSGNHRNAEQTDPGLRPLVTLAHRTGNSVSVVWDYEATSGQPPRWLALPHTLTVAASSMALLWTGRFHNASLMSPVLELGLDDEPFGFGFWDTHGSFYIGTPDQLSSVEGHGPLSPSVGLISSSPEEGIILNYRNNMLHLGALKPTTHQGGYLGKTVAFHKDGMIELSSLIIYGRSVSADDRLHAVQALGQNFGIPQQQLDSYVADGDSMTQGLGSQYAESYLWDLERLLPQSMVLYDAGWAAKTLGGADGLLDRYGTFTAKLYNPNARFNIISLMAGTNDLQNHSTGQNVYQLVQQYADAAHHTGFKVIISTILPRASFDARMEYQRVEANILLRSSWRTFADGLADLAADPNLGSPNATTNNLVYTSDGVHLTNYGYQIVASDLASIVNGLLRE